MHSNTVIIAIFIIAIIVIANGIRIITIGITATTEVRRRADVHPLSIRSIVSLRLQLLPAMLLELMPLVHADGAATHSAKHRVVPGHMAADRADGAVFQAATRFGLSQARQPAKGQGSGPRES
jgi:hypothetical protein